MDSTYIVAVVIVFPSIVSPYVPARCILISVSSISCDIYIFSGSHVSNIITTMLLFSKATRLDLIVFMPIHTSNLRHPRPRAVHYLRTVFDSHLNPVHVFPLG